MEPARINRKKLFFMSGGAVLLLLALALALYLHNALNYQKAFTNQAETGLPAVGSPAGAENTGQSELGAANVITILFLGIDRIE
jgi:hypothetical protein